MAIKPALVDNLTVTPLVPASTALAAGTLGWYDTANNLFKAASARSDLGSLAANQADFAPLFLGVLLDQRLAAEATSDRRLVATDGIFDCDCASASFKLGDLVGVDRASTPLNYDAQVVAVTQPHLAIGVVVKDTGGASMTSVRCRLTSKFAAALYSQDPTLFGGQRAGSAALADADVTLTVASALIQTGVPTAARKVILPAPAVSKGLAFLIVNNSAGANALNVRDNGDATTLAAVAQNKRALAFCDGTTWFALLGA